MTSSGESPKPTTPELPTTTPKSKLPKKPRNQPKYQTKLQQLKSILTSATSSAQNFLSQNDLQLLPSQSLALENLLTSLPFSPSPSISTPSFFHRFISTDPSDFDPRWALFFRMSKPTLSTLINLLYPSLINSLPSNIPPDIAIAAALFRLAHGATYPSLARRFGFESSKAACLAFYRVCKAISEKLSNLVEFKRNLEQTVVGFGRFGLPNCCGVLGFGEFGVDGELLGKESVLVQALVDSEGRFLDISAGWPSSMKPASVFSQSKFFLSIQESKEFINGNFVELSDGNSVPRYIVGQSCLPLLPWLLTPYIRPDEEDSFGSKEREFNSAQKRAMELVHTAFGRVKARWKLLNRRWKEECIEFFPFVIVMGCLLHNFLMQHNEPVPEECVKCSFKDKIKVFDGEVDKSGQRTRDALAQHLSRVNMRM